MTNDKNLHFEESEGEHESGGEAEHAPRARNRTVMLTPDITGQVRARLAKELDPMTMTPDVPSHSREGSLGGDGGFMPVAPRRSGAEAPSRGPSAASGQSDARRPEPVGRGQRAAPARGVPEYVAPEPAAPDGDTIEWKKTAPIVGILISYDRDPNGEIYPLRTGRLIVTSEMPSGGNYLFLSDESVSSMHAIMRISDDSEIQILDQLSENGTVIARAGEKDIRLSGDKAEVKHGDEVTFGERRFTLCILPKR